jgi:hypothetical protein
MCETAHIEWLKHLSERHAVNGRGTILALERTRGNFGLRWIFFAMRFLTPPPSDDDLNAAATSSSARYYSLASIRIILRRNTPALTASERLVGIWLSR